MNPHRQDLRGLFVIGFTENRSAENYLCYCETKQISVMFLCTPEAHDQRCSQCEGIQRVLRLRQCEMDTEIDRSEGAAWPPLILQVHYRI